MIVMKNIILFILTGMLVILWNVSAYASEEIYFDEEGNLIYVTYDKKAATNVSYKAIGWILKRYDAPLDAEGQQYVIVRKIEYGVDDPDNPGYMHCYFWSDKDEILDAVSAVSTGWKKQLKTYGETVYIDSVMTVCNSGVPLGSVDENGTCSGEVYYTCEGIQGARGWANKQYLTAYYDLELPFPILDEKKKLEQVDVTVTSHNKKSSLLSSFLIGSNAAGNEIYDVSKGLPSGEKIYFDGYANEYMYSIDYEKNAGAIKIPVKVTTKYIIKWVDYEGNKRKETKTIDRYYHVKRKYNYYTLKDVYISLLEGAVVNTPLRSKALRILSKNSSKISISVKSKNYGDYKKHIKIPKVELTTDDVVLESDNYKKPAIPDKSYKTLAEDNVEQLQVRSDYLLIDGEVVMDNAYCAKNGKSVNVDFTIGKCNVYKDKINTLTTVKNGTVSDSKVVLEYKKRGGTNIDKYTISDVGSVKIHTPVYTKGVLSSSKKFNQAVSPVESDVVLGKQFSVSIDNEGLHREIKGYGRRNYLKYVGNEYISLGIDVYKGNTLYRSENEFEIGKGITKLNVPNNSELRKFAIKYKSIATNGSLSDDVGRKKNLKLTQYGGTDSVNGKVIGRLYGFKIDNKYTVGKKNQDGQKVECQEDILPLIVNENKDADYQLSLISLGDYGAQTKVIATVDYYTLDDEGNIFATDELQENIEFINKEEQGDNEYIWSCTYNLPENIRNEEDKTYLVVFSPALYVKDQPVLSYINSANSGAGYCNMWKMEGFSYQWQWKDKVISLPDGCGLILNFDGIKEDEYQVVGTH